MVDNTKKSYKWVILAISFMFMLVFSISLQSLPPLFSRITEDIPFSNSQAGMLMGAYAIPGIILPFFIAFLSNKINNKMIINTALIIMIIGLTAFSLSNSFSMLLMYRIFTGIGATALVVLAPLLITMFFEQENIGVAMGIFHAAVPFGTVVAANLFGVLGERIKWRFTILGIVAFVGMVLAISFFLLSLPKRDDNMGSNEDRQDSQGKFGSNWSLWLLACIWTLANAQLLAYVTFAPQYFQKVGMSIQKAGLLSSFIMLFPIFLSPVVGIIIDKTGWKKQLLLMGAVLMGISFALIGKDTSNSVLWATILGIGFTPIPVIVFILLPEGVEEHQMGMGLGVLTAASNLGITIGPSAFGSLIDKTGGNFYFGFIVLALVSMGIILALAGFNGGRKDVHQ